MFKVEDAFDLEKHRDYEHSTFAEHVFDNGATYTVGPFVYCDVDPITEEELDPTQKYYLVNINLWHDGKDYIYLVPASPQGLPPNKFTIMKTMDEYNENRADGGRDIIYYIDAEETPDETYRGIISGRS